MNTASARLEVLQRHLTAETQSNYSDGHPLTLRVLHLVYTLCPCLLQRHGVPELQLNVCLWS